MSGAGEVRLPRHQASSSAASLVETFAQIFLYIACNTQRVAGLKYRAVFTRIDLNIYNLLIGYLKMVN